MTKTARPFFKVKRIAEQVNPLICQFLYAIVHELFFYPEFGPHFFQKFSWTSVKTLAMVIVALTAKMANFQGQMIPGEDIIFAKKFHGHPLRLSYGASWPSQPKQPIIKVNQALKQSMDFLVIRNSNLNFAKKFHGHPFRPLLCIQLALTAKTSHFQGQTIPIADKPPILRILLRSKLVITAKTTHFQGQSSLGVSKPPIIRFLCAIVHRFFGDP
ncbi:hypothetical protein H5410_054495 [Solanum commersonii]|uniref:Uncharacterized protein n=1 Tax=Solanum commersonii TaxID=4109 RepID=A0A9J5WF34_SOLCO|nr:hypothetical protein H5410_054495 [Solanum commersonii]